MSQNWPFKRNDVFPSFFANRIQDFLSAAETNLRLTRKNATTVEVIPDAELGIAGVAIQGRWRFNEEAISRAHPGGAKGTYTVWVVAVETDVDNSPDPSTDHTIYTFDLRITSGANPSGEGVDVFEKIGEIDWSGAAIEAIRQTHSSVTGPMIADGALSNDPSSDVTWTREPGGGLLANVNAKTIGATEVSDTLKPSKGAAAATEALRALGTSSSTAAAGNDVRLGDERTPKDNSVTSNKIVDGTIARTDLSNASRPINWYRLVDPGNDFFFEQTTYKFMDSVEGIVVPNNALVLVSYSALHRGGAVGAKHFAAIFFNEIQLKVPANAPEGIPAAQEMTYIAGSNASASWTFIYTVPWGLITPGVNNAGTEPARVEGEAIAASGVGGGFVAVRGLAAGTYEIGIKLKSSSNYSYVGRRNLQIGVCAPGA